MLWLTGCSGQGTVLLTEGWQYRWGDSPAAADGRLLWLDAQHEPSAWQPLAPPVRPDAPRTSDYLWARVRLPADLAPHDSAFFVFIDQAFEAYVGEERVFVHGVVGEDTRRLGRPSQLFSLGSEPAGKWLTLRIYSRHTTIGIAAFPRVGDTARLALAHLHAHPVLALVAFLSLGLALVAWTFFAFDRRDKGLGILGVLAFLCGAYSIVNAYSPLKPLLGGNPPPQIQLGSLFLIPAVYLGFYGLVRPRRVVVWYSRLLLGLTTMMVAASLVGLLTMYQALTVYKPVTMVAFAMGMVLAAVDLRKGRQGVWPFLVGFVGISMAIVHDALLESRAISGDALALTWGLVTVTVAHGAALLRTNAQDARAARRYAREIQQRGEELRQARKQVVAAASRLAGETQAIERTVARQLESTQAQASALQTSRSRVLSIAQTAQDAANEASTVAEATLRSEELSAEGQGTVRQTVEATNKLAAQVARLARDVEALTANAERIGEVIGAAQDVADETHVLAVNASLEAARAGEMGLGFAVVAGHMRSLAARSKDATLQVRQQLGDIRERAAGVAVAVAEGELRAKEAREHSESAGRCIEGLATVVRHAATSAGNIRSRVEQQSRAVQEIVEALEAASRSVEDLVQGTAEVERVAGGLASLSRSLAQDVAEGAEASGATKPNPL